MLIEFLECCDLVGNDTDRHWDCRLHTSSDGATKRRLQYSSCDDRHGQGQCSSVAGCRCLDEDIADWHAVCGVERVDAREHIFVEKADATAYRAFSFAVQVPGKAQLRCEIRVRLPDLIAQAREQRVELRNRGKHTIAAATVTHIAQSIS